MLMTFFGASSHRWNLELVVRARLRSADHGDVPRSCTVRFGQRSFRSSAPSVWNDLQSELKSGTGFKIVP